MNTNNIVNIEKAVVHACVDKLRGALGQVLRIRLKPAPRPDWDFELTIGIRPPLKLAVEMKTRLTTRTQALHLILQIQRGALPNAQAMVFADWIAEPVAEEFRKAGVNFVDTQGNIFLRKPPNIMIDIRGRRPEKPLKAEPGRLIEPGGLKVVHYLLTNPEALGKPLRAIAEGAYAALGTVHIIIRELERLQWLLPGGKAGHRWGDKRALVDLFVRGYTLKLRPVCLLGRYRNPKNNPRDVLDGFAKRLANMTGHWAVTGGMAARELTHYLEPDNLTLFVDGGAKEALDQEPMLRDDLNGNVTLLRMFTPNIVGLTTRTQVPLATPFLVYAELLQDGRPREVETAKMIYDQFIEPKAAVGR